jgi:hypothetical protein
MHPMRTSVLATLLFGWLVPLLVTAAIYYGAIQYEQNHSRSSWSGFAFFMLAPYFFGVLGVLNLWILALRNRKRLQVFSFGLVLPLAALIVLVVLSNDA